MFNQEIKEKYRIKKDEELEQIQAFRILGIFWFSLGATNLLFFILGLVFFITSVVKSKRMKIILPEGGLR